MSHLKYATYNSARELTAVYQPLAQLSGCPCLACQRLAFLHGPALFIVREANDVHRSLLTGALRKVGNISKGDMEIRATLHKIRQPTEA